MEEDGEPTTPFWLQNTTSFRHRRRSSSSICLNSGVLIVVLPVVAILVLVFVVPSLVSFTSQVVQPNLVKKSWNNLNFVLVLFAILCGIFGRKNAEEEDVTTTTPGAAAAAQTVAMQQEQEPNQQTWFGFSDEGRTVPTSNSNSMRRLKSSSSYPDLRQESLWASSANENWRFADDSNIYTHHRSTTNFDYGFQPLHHEQDSGIKTIPIDTFVVSNTNQQHPPPLSPPSPSPIKQEGRSVEPPPAPPPPPPPINKEKVRRVSQSVPKIREAMKEDVQEEVNEIRVIPQASTPPPPKKTSNTRSEQKKSIGKHERKKSSGAKEFATTLASFYNQRKRKKKQRSKENYDDILQSISFTFQEHSSPPAPPPPPPPPPPPASVFHQLFKKGSKSKRIHSLSPSVTSITNPPPPPPPPPAVERKKPLTPRRPPLPTKTNSLNEGDEYLNSGNQSPYDWKSGNQSPLIPMPPPPPPPPFRMPEFKYVVKGDFIRLRSTHSSRSTSPDLDSSVDSPLTPSSPLINGGGEAVVSAFCPSPDVDTKADTFIARFRAGLRLEKQESGVSGPSPRHGSSLRPT